MSERIFDLLRKVQAMTESDNPAEAKVATEKLQELLDRHGVELDELVNNEVTEYEFFHKNKYEKAILLQCYAFIMQTSKVTSLIRKGYTKRTWFTLTKVQYVDLKDCYDHYLEIWYEEVEILLSAFIQKHEIVGPSTPGKKCEMSEDELFRIFNMMDNLDGNSWENTRKLESGRNLLNEG